MSKGKSVLNFKGDSSTGTVYVIGLVLLLIVFGIVLVNGASPSNTQPTNGIPVTPDFQNPQTSKNNLQLNTFGYTTPAPTIIPTFQGSLCNNPYFKREPIIWYSPMSGQNISVGPNGQIKVWASDEIGIPIAPGEIVDTTGKITTPGDRTAKAPDGYLLEPALYIAPNLAETTSPQPHFPTVILGKNIGLKPLAPFEIPPPDLTRFDSGGKGSYLAEYIWDVSSLGLGTGNYLAEFTVHDGDGDLYQICIPIIIQ